MAVQTVTVTLSGTTTLTLDPSEIDLALGDAVVWKFVDISPDHLPFIFFQDSAENPQDSLGPFHSLGPSAREVVGVGNSGNPGPHAYTALVLSLSGPVATGTGNVNNLSSVADISPDAQVTVHSTPGVPPTSVPPTQKVTRGGTVVWSVVGLPDDAFVTLDFTDASNPFPDPLKGPFLLLSTSRGPNSSLVVTGVGLLSGFLTRSNDPIHYEITVRTAQGNILAQSHDPVIEPVGSPPT